MKEKVQIGREVNSPKTHHHSHHGHSHDHSHEIDYSKVNRAFYIGIGLNIGFVI